MRIEPFALERWFAEHEHDADVMLAESGIRSLPASRFDLDPGPLDYVIPTSGDPEFRAAVGERYGRGADGVVFTCGAQEANFLAFHALLGDPPVGDAPAGDSGPPSGSAAETPHAVCVTPAYQALHAVPESLADVTRVSLDPPRWELDVDEVAAAVRPETRLLVLNNPNNPTGRYHPRETVEALYDLAVDNDAHLLVDEVYRLLADDPQEPAATLGPRAVSTSSVSKAFGLAGLRFGWLAGDPAVVEAVERWKDYTTISPPLVGQHVARQALADEDAILAENRELVRDHRERVQAFLDEHGLDWYPPVGVNGFVTVPPGFDGSREFCRAVVEEANVVLAPGDAFGYDDYFRVGFGLPTDELVEGLDRVGRVIERRT